MVKVAFLLLAIVALVMPVSLTHGSVSVSTEFIKEQTKQVECLAKNIYFESRGEPRKGQLAVGFVTLNRVDSNKYPDSVCEVVYQKIRGRCQFSWVCQKKSKITDRNRFNSILDFSRGLYYNHTSIKDPSRGALFFCEKGAYSVLKRYNNVKVTAKIGDHIFYKRHARDRDTV
jgi:N-acetylmuramoyl-L-alanine amidase